MRRIVAALGLILGIAALGLQFTLTIPARLEAGDTLVGALVFYFSFFTIIANVGVTLVHAAACFPRARLGWFRRPGTRGLLVASIAFVGIFYHALMREIWAPEGLWLLADILLHYMTPAVYLLVWVAFWADGSLRFRQIFGWLLLPLAYIAYVFARGLATGAYPYALLDLGPHGWGPVVPRVVGLVFAFAALGLATIAIDKIKGRFARPERGPQ